MDRRIVALYDAFTHGGMDRREFMERLAVLAGGATAAALIAPVLENDYSGGGLIADEGTAAGERIAYPGASGAMKAYQAKPEGTGPFPSVIVIHENRGLNPHIEDVARRAAAAGWWAIAPDGLSASGGTPSDADAARESIGKLDMPVTVRDFAAAVEFARTIPGTTGKVGCVGFCWGGAMANQLAVNCPDLSAAVAFYGRQPAAADVPKIKAAVQLHYAGLDDRINAGIADYETALKAAGVRYELHMYDGVQHAFHNDTSAQRYDEEAAKLAWKRTLAFLDKHVRAPR